MRQCFLLTVLVCSHLGTSLAEQTPELSRANDVHLVSEKDKNGISQPSIKEVDEKPFDAIGAKSSFSSFGKKNDINEGVEHATGEQGSVLSEPGEGVPVPVSFWIPEDSIDLADNQIPAYEDSSALDYSETTDSENVIKRPFDRIGSSSFTSLGKRPFDRIGTSSFTSFGKRPFDRIGTSSFTSLGKRPFDRIGSSSFTSFGKRPFDRIGTSSFTSFGKRPFDRIGSSSFTSLGKRPFDRIGSSSFTSLGKRPFDRIGSSSFTSFGKRPFDRIGSSSFTSFGKRPFDRIGSSSFTSFGKRPFDRIATSSFTSLGKRPFDRIGSSSFTSFGKRPFDRIGTSSFTSLGKRPFDRIGSSSFTSLGKRPFDRIGTSSFTSFGKRENEDGEMEGLNSPIVDENIEKGNENTKTSPISGNAQSESSWKSQPENSKTSKASTFAENVPEEKSGTNSDSAIPENNMSARKRREALKRKEGELTLSLLSNHEDSGRPVAKRQISLSGNADHGDDAWLDNSLELTDDGLGDRDIGELENEKRRFDSLTRSSSFSPFGKRRFDRISGISSFSPFGKRRFDRISSYSGFGKFGKRRFDSIAGNSRFSSFGKRSFDRISSGFSPFGKRRFDRLDRASSFSRFGKRDLVNDESLDLGKRRFDRIDRESSFHSFGKRNADIELARALESVDNDLQWLTDNGHVFSKSPRVRIDSPWSERRTEDPVERLETLRLLETPTWLALQDSNGVDRE